MKTKFTNVTTKAKKICDTSHAHQTLRKPISRLSFFEAVPHC